MILIERERLFASRPRSGKSFRRPQASLRAQSGKVWETERVMRENDTWAATQLDKHRERICVLEAQVKALNWILHSVVETLPSNAYENLIPDLTQEANRLEGLMPGAEEVDRKAIDAGRKILLSARDAAASIVAGWVEKRS